MTKILIAEDDRQLSEGIRLSLREGDRTFFQCYTVADAARTVRREQPQLVILDVNFPDGSGLELLRQIRAEGLSCRVILLTANNMEADIVTGLESGADDYITKPFSLMVLRARVAVQLRNRAAAGGRQRGTGPDLDDGRFYFDFSRMIFRVNGEPVELSKTEARCLRILTENRGRTVTRELLIDSIWDGDSQYVDGHALTVTVKRLRDKLGEDGSEPRYLKTVYGIGYRFTGEDRLSEGCSASEGRSASEGCSASEGRSAGEGRRADKAQFTGEDRPAGRGAGR